jgi:hypothetical protein
LASESEYCYVFCMSTLDIELTFSEPLAGPFCLACGGRTRLAGLESHPRLPRTDIRTYECEACEAVQAVVAPQPSASINAMVAVGGSA